jgi:DNA-binding transcriptional regulator YiaG
LLQDRLKKQHNDLSPQQQEIQENDMARKKKLDFSDIAADRKKENLNQKDFWARYGVTQSGGSRYESGRNIPKPLAVLLWLHRSGKVSDKDLSDALK